MKIHAKIGTFPADFYFCTKRTPPKVGETIKVKSKNGYDARCNKWTEVSVDWYGQLPPPQGRRFVLPNFVQRTL